MCYKICYKCTLYVLPNYGPLLYLLVRVPSAKFYHINIPSTICSKLQYIISCMALGTLNVTIGIALGT